jgi:oxaloacetate decarboxylase alpha subunit
VPPLAEGSAQPSVLSTAENARRNGFSHNLDMELLQSISERLMQVARADAMPIGVPMQYDYAQYIDQIPGGVISNLRFQLAEIGLDDRLDEVIEECIQIREELGYPVMITPLSQYMGTQAAINVVTSERYQVVIDEFIRFAEGGYGEDSGYTRMDQNLKAKFLALPRAKELAAKARRPADDITLREIREQLGGAGISDEELILRAIMQGTQEIEAMHAAGTPRSCISGSRPLQALLRELGKHRSVRYIQVQRGADKLVLRNAGAA